VRAGTFGLSFAPVVDSTPISSSSAGPPTTWDSFRGHPGPSLRVAFSRHLDPHRVARRADAPRALRSGRGEPTLRGPAVLAKAAATARDEGRINDAAVEAGCDLAAIRRAYNVGGAIGDQVRATASPDRCLCGSRPWPPGPPSCRQVRRFAEEVVPAVREAAAASLRSPVPFEASRPSELPRRGEAVEGGPADGL
jgi:hypothetical protein